MNRTHDQLIFSESKEGGAACAQVIIFNGELVGRVATTSTTLPIDL
jgi:hypothetical protein